MVCIIAVAMVVEVLRQFYIMDLYASWVIKMGKKNCDNKKHVSFSFQEQVKKR